MLAFIKANALYVIYGVGWALGLLALLGKGEWLLLFLSAMFPLRNVVERLHGLPLGKDFLDILLIFAVLGWLIKSSQAKDDKFFAPSAFNIILPIVMLYTFFSLLHGNAYLGMDSLFSLSDPRLQAWKNYLIMPLMFFLVYNTVTDERWVWRFIAVMVAVMLLTDYYLTQQITWYSSIVSRKKICGTFVFLGPNEVAAFLNMYSILLMSLFFAVKRTLHRGILLLVLIWNMYNLIFLLSRAAYLAMAVGMFFLFAFRKKALLVPLLVVVLGWSIFLPDKAKQRIEMTKNEYGELDESAEGRIEIWHKSLMLFEENPIFGVGFYVFPYLGFELKDTHNVYLKFLAEQGMIGLVLFLITLGLMLAEGVRLALNGRDERTRALGMGFALSIVVAMINNIFGDRWTYMELGTNLWIFLGLVARLNLIHGRRRRAEILKQREETARRRRLQLAGAMP